MTFMNSVLSVCGKPQNGIRTGNLTINSVRAKCWWKVLYRGVNVVARTL